ncbi:MAG: alanine racemase [Bacteroidota bacterium]
MSTSIIEINKEALKNNILFLKNYYGENVRMSTILKGNAYGHGIEQVLPVFEEAGVDHFSVFSSDEAARVLKLKNCQCDLMIMGFIHSDELEWVINNDIEFYIFEPSYLERVIKIAEKLKKKARIHLEIETGMYRTGMTKEELRRALNYINDNPEQLHIKGFATHLAGAESIANYHRIQNQLKLFDKRVKFLKKNEIDADILHTASSAASITYPKSRMNMIRAGIISYGYWPTRETYMHFLQGNRERKDPLRRAIRWKTKIMSVKKVPEGEFIGYGYNFQADQEMQIATVPVGYSDGYSRQLSNNGHVLVRETRADVIGTVNMNMVLVNTSHIPDLKIGEEVVLLGSQGDNEISVASFLEMNNSMNYELLSRLPESIERVLS